MKKEYWRPIVGYEGLYEVSSLGRVKSLNYRRTGKEKILNPGNNDGYLHVNLCKNGEIQSKLVHQLVVEAFIPNPENKPFIDHINTIRNDNRVENLQWVTSKENANNPITKQHYSESKKGEKNPFFGKVYTEEEKRKLFEIQPIKKNVVCLKDNKVIKFYLSLHAVEKDGFQIPNVIACCKGRIKSHKGYNWRYATPDEISEINNKI